MRPICGLRLGATQNSTLKESAPSGPAYTDRTFVDNVGPACAGDCQTVVNCLHFYELCNRSTLNRIEPNSAEPRPTCSVRIGEPKRFSTILERIRQLAGIPS